jgi:urease gamma subunit
MTDTNNELNDFQKEVYAEYELIKSFEKSSKRTNESREKEKKGCLTLPFAAWADLFVGEILERERGKRNYRGNEQEARELLRQKEVSDKICEMVETIGSKEILTEEKFVYELTAAFYQSDLASRLVIPENVVLYAMMATEVFNIGLGNFCNDKKGY